MLAVLVCLVHRRRRLVPDLGMSKREKPLAVHRGIIVGKRLLLSFHYHISSSIPFTLSLPLHNPFR